MILYLYVCRELYLFGHSLLYPRPPSQYILQPVLPVSFVIKGFEGTGLLTRLQWASRAGAVSAEKNVLIFDHDGGISFWTVIVASLRPTLPPCLGGEGTQTRNSTTIEQPPSGASTRRT